MIAETAELVAELNLKGNFEQMARRARKTLTGLHMDTARLRGELRKAGDGLKKSLKVGAGIAAGGVALLALNVRSGIDSLAELEDVTNQTNARLKATKGVAGLTADSIRKLAEKYEDLTTVDDKVIQQGENLLLTFTNVRKKAFEPAIAAALDMATALNMDTNAAVKALGKALQDPITGLSRLTRLGVSFTEGEKAKVKALVESGRTLDAQRLILGKLNRMYGGSAQKAAEGYRGQQRRLRDAVEGLQQALARALLPALTKVSRKITNFLKAPEVEKQVTRIGDALAGLFDDKQIMGQDASDRGKVVATVASPFTTGIGLIKDAFNEIKNLPWDVIKGSLNTTLEVGRQALDIFHDLPKEVQAGIITLLAANKVTGGALAGLGKIALDLALGSLKTIMAGNVTVIGTNVTGAGGTGAPVPAKAGVGVGAFLGAAGAVALLNQVLRDPGDKKPDEYGPLGGLGMTGWDEQQVQNLMDRMDATKQNTSTTAERVLDIPKNVQPFFTPIYQKLGIQATEQKATIDAVKKGSASLLERTVRAHATSQRQVELQRLQNATQKLQTPILGRIFGAANATKLAVMRQDLSVRVNVSATSVVEGVTRATSQNRVVVS